MIAIAGRLTDPRVGEAIDVLSAHLRSQGHTVRSPAADDTASASDWRYDDSFVRGASLVVAVGGDGTMLHVLVHPDPGDALTSSRVRCAEGRLAKTFLSWSYVFPATRVACDENQRAG